MLKRCLHLGDMATQAHSRPDPRRRLQPRLLLARHGHPPASHASGRPLAIGQSTVEDLIMTSPALAFCRSACVLSPGRACLKGWWLTLWPARPDPVRPWQHVLSPLAAYLTLMEPLWRYSSLALAYNFESSMEASATVRRFVRLARDAFARVERTLQPATYGPVESHWLSLADSKSAPAAGITPRFDLQSLVARTVRWCCDQFRDESAAALYYTDINSFAIVNKGPQSQQSTKRSRYATP